MISKQERQQLREALKEVETLKSSLAKALSDAREAKRLRADDLVTTVRMHRRSMAAEQMLHNARDVVGAAVNSLKQYREVLRSSAGDTSEVDDRLAKCETFLANAPSEDSSREELAIRASLNEPEPGHSRIDPRDNEIDRLTEQNQRLDAMLGDLAHERDEAKAALRPFAVLGRMLRSASYPDKADIWGYKEATLTVGDFRQAAAVLLARQPPPEDDNA